MEIQSHLLPTAGAPTSPRPPEALGTCESRAAPAPSPPLPGSSSPLPHPLRGICAPQLPRPQSRIAGSRFWRGAWEAEAAARKPCGSGNLGGSWRPRSAHRPFPLWPRGGAWLSAQLQPLRLRWEPRSPCLQDWLPGPSPTSVGQCTYQGLSEGGRSVGWEQFGHISPLPASLLKAAGRAHCLLVNSRGGICGKGDPPAPTLETVDSWWGWG